MNRIKKYLKITLYTLLILFFLITGLISFLLTTTPGLYTSIKLANLFLPGTISIKKPKGSLLDRFSLKQLQYKDPFNTIKFKNVHVNWQLTSLLKKQILIDSIKVEQLQFHLKTPPSEKKKQRGINLEFPQLPVQISVKKLAIEKIQFQQDKSIQYFQEVRLQAELNEKEWTVNPFLLGYDDYKINMEASIQATPPHSIDIKAKIFKNTFEQQVMGTFTAGGDYNLYHWQGSFKEPFNVNLFGTLTHGNKLENIIKWETVKWPMKKDKKVQLSKGRLALTGNLPNLSLDVNTKIKYPVDASLRIKADYKMKQLNANTVIQYKDGYLQSRFKINHQTQPAVSGHILTKSLDLNWLIPGLSKVNIDGKFMGSSFKKLNFNAQMNANLHENSLTASANYSPDTYKVKINLAKNYLELQGTSTYKWQLYSKIPQLEELHPALKGLKTTIVLQAAVSSPRKGAFILTFNQGRYQLPKESPMPNLFFFGGSLKGKLSTASLSATGAFQIDAQKTISMSFSLPKFHLDSGLTPQQPVNADVKLTINSLSFLNKLSTDIQKLQGSLNAHLKLSGIVSNLHTEGKLNIENAQMHLPEQGIHLSQIQTSLSSANKNWQLKASLKSQNHPLIVTGNGSLMPSAKGTLYVKGTNVPIYDTEEYSINASPDLTISYDKSQTNIQGTITIPKALLKPESFSQSVSVSPDVEFIDEQKEQKSPSKMNANVKIVMGDQVKLDIQGLKGDLTGSININQQAGGVLNASGNLSVEKGSYKADGQDLTIEEGKLLFTGGSITNPGISVKAVRKFSNASTSFAGSNQLFDFNTTNIQDLNLSNNVTVGIQVTGRIDSPDIELFSNPPGMKQADILSMLLLGRPASQAGKAKGQLLLSAVSAMNLDSGTEGTQLLSQLKNETGIDIDFQTNTVYNRQTNTVSDSDTLVIGKSLSKRLYISYNMGLLQADTSVLTLKYLLNKFFSIEVSASDSGNGIDFLYTRQKNTLWN